MVILAMVILAMVVLAMVILAMVILVTDPTRGGRSSRPCHP